jgi:hypothetical protein
MEVFSDSGNSFGKVPLLCRYAENHFLMRINRSKDRSLRQLLQNVRRANVGAAEGCDLLRFTPTSED